MALLALITFGNVLVRYFTDASFAWTEEISIFLMILLAMVAGSAAVARDQHIRIEFLTSRGTAARKKGAGALGFCVRSPTFWTAGGAERPRRVDDWRYEETSPGIGVPQWWYSIWLPICSLAITARAIGLFIRQGKPGALESEIIESRRNHRQGAAMIATLLFVAFLVLMFLGVPIGAALGLAGAACIALASLDTQWFGLLAVPQNFYAGLGSTRFWPFPCLCWWAPSLTAPASPPAW